MAATGQVITIESTATLIFEVVDPITYATLSNPAANIFKSGTNNDPLPIELIFASDNTIYLGGSTVAASGGSVGALATGLVSLSYNCIGDDSLYGIVATGTQAVQLLVLRQ